MMENEMVSYEWTLEQTKGANDKRIVKNLEEIGKPPYTGDWQKKFITERRYLGKYGGEFHGSPKGAFPVVEEYFNSLKAPARKLIWFDNSTHLPHIEENEKFNSLMVNQVLPLSQIM